MAPTQSQGGQIKLDVNQFNSGAFSPTGAALDEPPPQVANSLPITTAVTALGNYAIAFLNERAYLRVLAWSDKLTPYGLKTTMTPQEAKAAKEIVDQLFNELKEALKDEPFTVRMLQRLCDGIKSSIDYAATLAA